MKSIMSRLVESMVKNDIDTSFLPEGILSEIEQLESISNNSQNELKEVSKKLSKTMKELGEDEMISQLVYERSIILDHFTLAYMAETGKKPSEVKLVTEPSENGIQMFFEDKNELKLHSKDGERIY